MRRDSGGLPCLRRGISFCNTPSKRWTCPPVSGILMQMSPPDWPRLGRYVRERRAELGLTQEEVATRGGPSTATLRLIEGGEHGPFRAKSLRQLADALHWTPESPRAILTGREPVEVADGHPPVSVSTDPEPTEAEPAPVSPAVASAIGDAIDSLLGPFAPAIDAEIRRARMRNPHATGADIFANRFEAEMFAIYSPDIWDAPDSDVKRYRRARTLANIAYLRQRRLQDEAEAENGKFPNRSS